MSTIKSLVHVLHIAKTNLSSLVKKAINNTIIQEMSNFPCASTYNPSLAFGLTFSQKTPTEV